MGIMLMIFTPMPYVDATSAWGFRSRWKRVLVGAAGMIAEIFVAALATMVWANTAPGIERYLFGVTKAESPSQSRREKMWFTLYGLTSNVYRIVVFAGILLFVADRFLLIGIVMAIVCLISWVMVPVVGLIKYLAVSPALQARQDGLWVAPQLKDFVGRWLLRGTSLGLIIEPSGFEFTATVAQEDGDSFFTSKVQGAEAKLFGEFDKVLALGPLKRLPVGIGPC